MTPFRIALLLGLLTGRAACAQLSAAGSAAARPSFQAAAADTIAGGGLVAKTPPQLADRRLTAAMRSSPYGLPQVLRMRPVTYTWKHRRTTPRLLGFIAQDIEQLVPEAVAAPQAANEYYGLHYEELIPVLTKAIQEQQAQIETLQAVNGRLQASLEILHIQVRQLRAASN